MGCGSAVAARQPAGLAVVERMVVTDYQVCNRLRMGKREEGIALQKRFVQIAEGSFESDVHLISVIRLAEILSSSLSDCDKDGEDAIFEVLDLVELAQRCLAKMDNVPPALRARYLLLRAHAFFQRGGLEPERKAGSWQVAQDTYEELSSLLQEEGAALFAGSDRSAGARVDSSEYMPRYLRRRAEFSVMAGRPNEARALLVKLPGYLPDDTSPNAKKNAPKTAFDALVRRKAALQLAANRRAPASPGERTVPEAPQHQQTARQTCASCSVEQGGAFCAGCGYRLTPVDRPLCTAAANLPRKTFAGVVGAL
ncbi:hypothetical protein DIPPA_09653 [Diplonema papillatum]|nr:hypothetical protein DIPPA_09653 [Diplonema papillatum]